MRPHINAIEGVGCACLLCVDWVGGCACVFVVIEPAVNVPKERIQIAIAINVGKGGVVVIPQRKAIEGVGCACLLGIDWVGGCACVFVVPERAESVPNNGIQIAIAIDVGEGGAAVSILHLSKAIEGVGCACLLGVDWVGRCACVFVVQDRAGKKIPKNGIQIAIAIDVGKAGADVQIPRISINAIEGVGCACLLGIDWVGGCACVFVVQRAVSFPNNGI
ncbi:MAG: hypothetical protein RMX97_00320 [Nostoc sp. DedQUE11]|nr:hypothetical protein [Nostoc sp. DedQUE11]